jgi:hypothetical protein
MSDDAVMEIEAKLPMEISTFRYDRALKRITLLRTMSEITNSEVKRIISLIESPDMENWHVAEESIKSMLSFTK